MTPRTPAHRDANVLRWLAAYALSTVGDGVCFLALGWAARDVGGPGQVGLVMATAAVPRAVLLLGGGVVADRLGPRRVLLGSDAVRCAAVLAVAAALAWSSPGLWVLVSGALVFGVVDALFLPAVGALPPRLTTPGQLARVQGLRLLAVRAGATAGPPLGGFAVGVGGEAAALACAGALFALSVPLLSALRVAPLPVDASQLPGVTVSRELLDGLRHVRRHRLLGPLLLSGALSELGANGPLAVGILLLSDARGWGPGGMGWILAAFGAGAAAGALALSAWRRVPRAGVVQIAMLVLASAAIGAIGLTPTLPLAVFAAAGAGVTGGICGGLAHALVQTATDPRYLGRVTAVMSLTGLGLAPLTYPVFDLAVSAWGVAPVFAAGGLLSMTGALVTLASPAVRRAELPR